MALTGLVLAGFVLGHMTGNLLMFKSPAAINAYAKWLHENVALLWTAPTVLIISVFAHIWVGIQLTLENRAARAGGPAAEATRREHERLNRPQLEAVERRDVAGLIRATAAGIRVTGGR